MTQLASVFSKSQSRYLTEKWSITSLEELLKLSDEQILRTPMIGKKFVWRLRTKFAETHPENVCMDCLGPNPKWHATNSLWNSVMGSDGGIICPSCFEKRAKIKRISFEFIAYKD